MLLHFVGQPSTVNFLASCITKSLSASLISSRRTSGTVQDNVTSLTYMHSNFLYCSLIFFVTCRQRMPREDIDVISKILCNSKRLNMPFRQSLSKVVVGTHAVLDRNSIYTVCCAQYCAQVAKRHTIASLSM
jgi:hypothetical protein